MIKKIIDLLYTLSKEHILVKTFRYGRLSKEAGTGEDIPPLVFVEDPIYFGNADVEDGQITATVNIDIVASKQIFDNYEVAKPLTVDIQNLCHSIALNFVAKIYKDEQESDDKVLFQISSYSIQTLTHWYDDDFDGVRLTLNLLVTNTIYFCDLDTHFSDDKEFDVYKLLPDINTSVDDAICTTFDYKLPKINLLSDDSE